MPSINMKIIGHRGAAGLALENTISSLEVACLLNIGAIELDVRKTKDNRLVVCHDGDLMRIGKNPIKIAETTLKKLQSIVLIDGHSRIPTLEGALRAAGNTPLIIEIKSSGCSKLLADFVAANPDSKLSFASFKHGELLKLRKLGVGSPLIALEHTKPFDIIHFAKRDHFDGIGLKFWLLNPLTYLLAKRANLSIYVYTVNSQLIGRLIGKIYPSVGICTDRPELFIKHPWIKLRKSFNKSAKD